MRTLLFLAAMGMVAGCGVECPGTDSINGRYAVFSNVIDDPGDVATVGNYPSWASPVNGWSEWSFLWESNSVVSGGGILVTINDQDAQADGTWDDVQCGNFTLSITNFNFDSGEGTDHVITLDGSFVHFSNKIQGTMTWTEDWSYDATDTAVPEGPTSGEFTTTAQFDGTYVGETSAH